MDTTTQTLTGAKHADDDTLCAHPDVCGLVRMVYYPGGRPDFGVTLGE